MTICYAISHLLFLNWEERPFVRREIIQYETIGSPGTCDRQAARSSSSSESKAVSQLSLRDRKQWLPPSLPPSLTPLLPGSHHRPTGTLAGTNPTSVRDTHAITTPPQAHQLMRSAAPCDWRRGSPFGNVCEVSERIWIKKNRVILQVRARTVALGFWLSSTTTVSQTDNKRAVRHNRR